MTGECIRGGVFDHVAQLSPAPLRVSVGTKIESTTNPNNRVNQLSLPCLVRGEEGVEGLLRGAGEGFLSEHIPSAIAVLVTVPQSGQLLQRPPQLRVAGLEGVSLLEQVADLPSSGIALAF